MTSVTMKEGGNLSIRSYTLTQYTHFHRFHQIVVPLNGAMDIAFAEQRYAVGVGHCVVIASEAVHSYSAPEQSNFLVADIAHLPPNAASLQEPCVAISDDLLAFCSYAQTQLQRTSDQETGVLLFSLFWHLFEQQAFAARLDDRVMRAVTVIEKDLAKTYSIENLAEIACLSASQFKALFKRSVGCSSTEYLLTRRMERARALLLNTDYPIQVVAHRIGYDDASAFSRRFRSYFGQSPRQFSRGN